MKLLYVWPSAEFSTWDVANGLHKAFTAQGHTLRDYRLYNRIKAWTVVAEKWRPDEQEVDIVECVSRASEGIVQEAILHNVDWLLAVSTMGLHPDALLAFKRIGGRTAAYFTEGPYDTTDEKDLMLCKEGLIDVAFVNERAVVGLYAAAMASHGGRAVYLRHSYDPDVHAPQEADPEHVCDVVMIGTGFAERQTLFEAIDWTGIDLRLGGLWTGIEKPSHLEPRLVYPCLDNELVVKLYSGAKIVLNPHRWGDGAESANPRVFEAAACGAFQISDYRREVEEIFGDAIPMFDPGVPWQLEALVRKYLDMPQERARLSALARERVMGHTFDDRAGLITKTLERAALAQAA